jgi:hypothetical protein
MKDRLSIHVENGQANTLEAITLLRNGGTPSQSGLVGITNKTHTDAEAPILPETIFNIQATGDATSRITSLQNSGRSKVELLANTNTPISGLSISYQKKFASSSYELGKFSNTEELSFFVHQSGTTAIGDIRSYTNNSIVDLSLVDGKSALSVSRSGNPYASGTIAIREQSNKPLVSDNFGKIYVKPYSYTDQTQSLFFLDDANNEHNATPNIKDTLGGTVYGDSNGNTFAGWYSPRTRGLNGSTLRNTYFGYGISTLTSAQDNTFIGHKAASGTNNMRENTVIGSHSLTQTYSSSGNIVIGHNNVTYADESQAGLDPVNDLIIIGNNLYVDDYPDDFTLAIGVQGTPIVTGLLKGPSRKFSIISSSSEDTRFTVDKYPYDFNLGLVTEGGRGVVTFGSQDSVNNQQTRSMMSMRFKDSLNNEQTLVDYDPSGTPYTTASFSSPAIRRPTVSVSGDIRLLGTIRFADGSTISSSAAMKDHFGLANSGIKRTLIDNAYYFGLDFDSVPLATDQVGTINPSQTYVAVDLPNNFGKMSIASLAAYMTSGSAIFGDQCNAVFTNTSNHQYIKTDRNSNSIFIGCDVASSATGWKHGVFIGTNAGKNSTTPNVGLATDTACVYIGLMAGQDAANTNDTICIGNSAGKNADSSNKSIFIGPSAGQNSTNPDSIGIGAHALQGELSQAEGGSRNIEIIAGLDDNQRLMYTSGVLSDKLNIQNTIAADTKYRKVSIGNARLNPQAVLEVARDTRTTWLHDGHTHPDIQRWINNGSGIARVNASGAFIVRTNAGASLNHPTESGATCESFFGTHEGFMTEYIYAPASYTSPTSGWMRVRNYETGFATDRLLLVTNRDTTLNIHGPGADGGAAFVVTMMVNGEHRPVYVSCSGAS